MRKIVLASAFAVGLGLAGTAFASSIIVSTAAGDVMPSHGAADELHDKSMQVASSDDERGSERKRHRSHDDRKDRSAGDRDDDRRDRDGDRDRSRRGDKHKDRDARRS